YTAQIHYADPIRDAQRGQVNTVEDLLHVDRRSGLLQHDQGIELQLPCIRAGPPERFVQHGDRIACATPSEEDEAEPTKGVFVSIRMACRFRKTRLGTVEITELQMT